MAQLCQPCQCVPYDVICSCGPSKGISAIQPSCQTLPDGSVVNNPCFITTPMKKSYWTYKFITDCANNTAAINNFCIPICESINRENMIVNENIDGCGEYRPVSFELIKSDPQYGNAPAGFQWLKVETGNRYEKGVSVAYRLEITGDYPTGVQPIKVKAGNTMYTFDCGCFLVPACSKEGKLLVSNNQDYVVNGNKATVNYYIEVVNAGSAPLNNVRFLDKVFYPSNLTLGPINVTHTKLKSNISAPGEFTISGNLGAINPGQVIPIKYTVPVAGIPFQGTFTINKKTTITDSHISAEDTCHSMLEAVRLNASMRSTIKDKQVVFTTKLISTNESPETKVNMLDQLIIPEGLTVQLSHLDGCTAVFDGTGNPAPLNKDISGEVKINIKCNNMTVPKNGAAQKNIALTIISTTLGSPKYLANTLQIVKPANSDQVFIGAANVPVTAKIIISTPGTK